MAERLNTRALLGPSAREILGTELNVLKGNIAQNIMQHNANASGRTIRSLSVRVSEDGDTYTGELTGRPFFGALETGSKPWRNQYKHPPLFFREIIQQWIDDKGLDLNAYLVARKIMRTGSKLYREGGRDSIYSKEIRKTIERVNRRALQFWNNVLTNNIKLN